MTDAAKQLAEIAAGPTPVNFPFGKVPVTPAEIAELEALQKAVGMAGFHDAKSRKAAPMARGVLDYFPDALAMVAEVSRIGNEQHNPGQPLHWAKEKSTDHADCILRHLKDRGTVDEMDNVIHDGKTAWRALANLQIAIECVRAGRLPPK